MNIHNTFLGYHNVALCDMILERQQNKWVVKLYETFEMQAEVGGWTQVHTHLARKRVP